MYALYAVDWILPEVLCLKQGGYGGRARYILKDSLKFLPLYGWYLGMVSDGWALVGFWSAAHTHTQRGGIFVKQGKSRHQSSITR